AGARESSRAHVVPGGRSRVAAKEAAEDGSPRVPPRRAPMPSKLQGSSDRRARPGDSGLEAPTSDRKARIPPHDPVPEAPAALNRFRPASATPWRSVADLEASKGRSLGGQPARSVPRRRPEAISRS